MSAKAIDDSHLHRHQCGTRAPRVALQPGQVLHCAPLTLKLDTPTVLDPAGRIAFHTPDDGGQRVRGNTVFALQPEPPRDFPAMPEPAKKTTPRLFPR